MAKQPSKLTCDSWCLWMLRNGDKVDSIDQAGWYWTRLHLASQCSPDLYEAWRKHARVLHQYSTVRRPFPSEIREIHQDVKETCENALSPLAAFRYDPSKAIRGFLAEFRFNEH